MVVRGQFYGGNEKVGEFQTAECCDAETPTTDQLPSIIVIVEPVYRLVAIATIRTHL